MKHTLSDTDRKSIIQALKADAFPVHELKHLFREVHDHTRTIEILTEYFLPITTNDKRELLKALRSGCIDFENIPDLKAAIEENVFLKMMKRAALR